MKTCVCRRGEIVSNHFWGLLVRSNFHDHFPSFYHIFCFDLIRREFINQSVLKYCTGLGLANLTHWLLWEFEIHLPTENIHRRAPVNLTQPICRDSLRIAIVPLVKRLSFRWPPEGYTECFREQWIWNDIENN